MSGINADRMLTDEIFELARKGFKLNQIKNMLELDMNIESIRKRIKRHPDYTPQIGELIKATAMGENASEEPVIQDRVEIEILENGAQRSTRNIEIEDENILRSEKDLLLLHNYDPSMWEIQSAKNSKWNAQKKGGVVTTLYSSKITVKPIRGGIPDKVMEELFDNLTLNYERPVIERNKTAGDKMLEINICDLHLGKMSWNEETGENYDHKIAEKRFFKVIDDVIQKTKYQSFDKILFVFGNDFFNYSDTIGNTLGGTRQDNDLRWQKMFQVGCDMVIKALDMLAEISNVELLYVPGNHDIQPAFYAYEKFRGWYRNDERVTIIKDIKERKYYRYGNSLIGFTHGAKEKKRLAHLMQTEAKKDWGETDFHEYHCGHFHSDRSKEEDGITIRWLSSPTSTDAWHFGEGYTTAIPKAQSFIWDKKRGLESILYSYI